MTEIEDLILENQIRIMCGLSLLLGDGDKEIQAMARRMIDAASLAQEQLDVWRQSSR